MTASKHIFRYVLAPLLIPAFLFVTIPSPRAAEKTPPCYPEGYRDTSAPPPKPDAGDKVERIPGIDDKYIRTEEYVVKEGDYLVKILKERGLLKDQNLPELLSLLRKLNTSLQDLDMIQPGEKIVILVKVVPGGPAEEGSARKLKAEKYRVKPGDILSRLAIQRYDLSARQLNREYLALFRECNPSIRNPDRIYAGQTIKLPYYPPEVVGTTDKPPILRDLEKSPNRIALKRPKALPEEVKLPEPKVSPTPPRPEPVKAKPQPPPPSAATTPARRSAPRVRDRQATIIITDGLGNVISRIGEEWIHSGEHFIPMKSSGHINLKAESYPIIRLNKGITVIVDMYSALPKKMARVIESTWASYRVVHLSSNDDLRSALEKILRAFDYPKVFKKDQPLTLGGNIPVSITGDWIVAPPEAATGKGPGFIVINLMDAQSQGLPRTIKNYLKVLGVEVIEYPAVGEEPGDTDTLSAPETAEDPESLIKPILNLAGQSFSTRVNIPAYESRNEDFKFTVKADFYFEIVGKPHIIDVTGLGPDVISLLKENGATVLSLAEDEAPVNIVSKTLKFLDVSYKAGPHSFMAKKGDVSRNVKLTLPGIVFKDRKGDYVLVTSLEVPSEIAAFLSQRGYSLLIISPFSHLDSQSS